MTTAIYRYCSNPYSVPKKLYSNSHCEVLGFSGRWATIRLLEFSSRGHKPGDVMRVLRRSIHITGAAPYCHSRMVINMSSVRLPYKD